MRIQVVNFNLQGMSDGEFRAMCDELASTFAAVPGLVSKTWLSDEASNTYGGVYLWQDTKACREYQESELFNVVKTHPNFANVASKDYDVIEGPSIVTRGINISAVPA